MANTLNGRLTPANNMRGALTNEGRLTGQLGGVGAAVTYASLPDKPSINNVELVGNKTTSDLNISYNDLRDQPVIPDVGEIDERLDDLEGDITSLGGRVTTAEGNITTLQGDTGALDTRLTTAEGNITTLQGDTGALDTRLTTAEGNITSIGGRLTTAEGNITSLNGRVTTNEGNITSLDGRVTTNEGNISDLQGDMTQAQSDITQLNSSLTNLVHTQSGSGAYDVNATLQINSNILNHSVIVICCGRYGYGNSIVLSSGSISAGFYANGIGAYINSIRHVTLKVSTSGLITVVETNDALNITIIGIN